MPEPGLFCLLNPINVVLQQMWRWKKVPLIKENFSGFEFVLFFIIMNGQASEFYALS
jgi:hypothetical protein